MKKAQFFNRENGRSKILTAILAAAIALVVLAVSLFVIKPMPAANAESGGSVTIHVYDASQSYSSLAAWVWLDGGAGKEYKISSSAAKDEQFFKEYEDGGKTVKNAARTFDIPLTESQLASLKATDKSAKRLGFLICHSTGDSGTDFWKRYDKETSDVMVELATAFDSNNHADVYYVRKDATAYTDLEEALKTLEKIINARFTAKTAKTATVEFETTTPIKSSDKAYLKNGDKTLGNPQPITVSPSNKCVGTATFNITFSFSTDYTILTDSVATGCTVNKTAFIDDADFIRTFESADTQGQALGCTYTKTATTFRVWAPFATDVTLKLYESDSAPEGVEHEMEKHIPKSGTWGGVWALTVEGDLNGKFYTYVVNNGAPIETIDPYAKACGTNGLRGMVADLKATDPLGWKEDKTWRDKNAIAVDTPIIWEVTVSDFSSSADSGMKYKGKYLAFTEKGTTVPGTNLKTGVDYLKDLGITYVHLNPVYDFATVDEGDMTLADNGSFNWGYDPQNYNIPEGSYSTNPADGAVRINEFKRMVKALHDAGIGVVMDVVYNHTFSTGGQPLHDTVPYYYHRTDASGSFTNGSGCGNETASERTMMRKYIVDSMTYWAEEYHIDGFRFDLMGVHDIDTIRAVRTALDKIDKRILIYGEPWSADGTYVPPSYSERVKVSKAASGITGYAINSDSNNLIKKLFAGDGDYPRDMSGLPERVAVFNDTGREGLRGNNDPGQGWANGAPYMVGKVERMLEGGAGGSGEGMKLGNGARNVAYACAHDNYTLWDQIRGKKQGNESPLYYDDPVENDIKKCKLVASAYMMSTGMCFMIAGEEMGRTKYGNDNSYNSPVKLNQINWARQEAFSDLRNYYKKLIALRKQYSEKLFSYSKSTSASFCYGNFGGGSNGTTGAISFTRTQNSATLTLALNPTALTGTVKIGSTTLNINTKY